MAADGLRLSICKEDFIAACAKIPGGDVPVFHGNPRGDKALKLFFAIAPEDSFLLDRGIDQGKNGEIVTVKELIMQTVCTLDNH